MTDSRSNALLAVVAELEARDGRVAEELAGIGELTTRAAAVDGRARELGAFLEALPAELAIIDDQEAMLEARLGRARAEEEEAARRIAELERARRAADRLAQAEQERERAREAAADAARGIERLQGRRDALLSDEARSRSETEGLGVEAQNVAAEVRRASRVSASGRSEPGSGLDELAAWANRVRTALLVARVGLDAERERIVREANELGAAVLGESLGGSSVGLVRRRLEQSLASSRDPG